MRTVLLNTLEWFADANDRQRLLADKQKRLKSRQSQRRHRRRRRHHGDYLLVYEVRLPQRHQTHKKLLRNVFQINFCARKCMNCRPPPNDFGSLLFCSLGWPGLGAGEENGCLLASVCLLTALRTVGGIADALSSTHCRKIPSERPHHVASACPPMRCQQLLSRFHFFLRQRQCVSSLCFAHCVVFV